MLRPALAAALLLSSPAFAAAECGALAALQQDPQAAYTKLAKDFAKAMSKFQEELQAKVQAAREAGERVPRSAYRQPTKEFVTPEQVAELTKFLCSPAADQINGALMSMDGGWVAQ